MESPLDRSGTPVETAPPIPQRFHIANDLLLEGIERDEAEVHLRALPHRLAAAPLLHAVVRRRRGRRLRVRRGLLQRLRDEGVPLIADH